MSTSDESIERREAAAPVEDTEGHKKAFAPDEEDTEGHRRI